MTMEACLGIISAGFASFVEVYELNGDLSLLRTSLVRARLLIDCAELARFKEEELAALLSQLKDTTYDAEDLIREFHGQELRQERENAVRSWAGQLLSPWFNPVRNLILRSKTRVQQIQSKLDKVVAEMERTLKFVGRNGVPAQLMPETTSVIKKLFGPFGRDKERDQVIEMLGVPIGPGKRKAAGAGNESRYKAKRQKGESSRARPSVANETNCTKNVSVLAIVGIGGEGKTTLAQFIYNDSRVKAHFDLTMWICVSDLFDIERMTIQIMKCASCETSDTMESLNHPHEQLKKQLEKKKFLLVLDDVWPIPNQDWQRFLAPLMFGREGSMILVTTRFPKIAKLVAPPTQHVQLEGLPAATLWDIFQICAFGNSNRSAESYPRLEAIGQRIAGRLCGSPLAAKTLGCLLNLELTEDHWMRIQNSELWQLPHEENDILQALEVSYLRLPAHLKRCFVFCSMFPKRYSFERDKIVDLWVSLGFVPPVGGMRLEDTGSRYFDELSSMLLFQADPKLRKSFVINDLIYDMARSVSVDECFLMQDLCYENQWGMPHTVRHMSIEVHSEALSRMAGPYHLNKLHSIRFGTRLEVQISWFNQLSNILFLSLKDCKLAKLPESICELNSLRYLDISGSDVHELPEKFGCLYNLQVFDASHSRLQTFNADIKNLINLRRLELPQEASRRLPMISGLGNLSSLRNLRCFLVGNENGRGIGELKGMNQLSGTLSIKCISEVQSRAEAAEARLVDKQYLKDVTLHWREQGCDHTMSAENEVLKALRPPSRIEGLKVQGFGGDISADWLNPEDLPTIRSLELSECRSLRSLSSDSSLPVHNFVGFSCLQDLRIHHCVSLVCPPEMVLPPLLQRLSICNCRELDKSFPGCLENLGFLTLLHLDSCSNVESIPLSSIDTNKLQCLVLRNCSELSFIGRRRALSSIQHVDISGCPKLTEVQQPFEEKGLRPEEEKEALEFMGVLP